MTADSFPLTKNLALWLELTQFYSREAWLLDERRFEQWLELFAEDLLYFMPRRKNVSRRDAARELSAPGDLAFLEEDKRYMRMRVARLESGMAWAENPPSRTRHIISNLLVDEHDDGTVTAKTAFLIYRSHLEIDTSFFAGSREDTLRPEGDGWKIAKRVIILDANVLPDKNLSVFF